MTEYLPDCCNRVTVLLEYLELMEKSHCLYRHLIRYITSNGFLPLLHCISMDLIELGWYSGYLCIFKSTGKFALLGHIFISFSSPPALLFSLPHLFFTN